MSPEKKLKEHMRQAGIQVLDVCTQINRPYGTVAGWLNGFAPLPIDARNEIIKMIESRKIMKSNSVEGTRK